MPRVSTFMLLCAVAVLLLAAGEPFQAAGGAPAAITVVLDAAAAPPIARGPMLDRLTGVIARLDRKAAAKLAACESRPIKQLPESATRWCTARCAPRNSDRQPGSWDVLRDANGRWYARAAQGVNEELFELDHDRFAQLASEWDQFRGSFIAPAATNAAGKVEPLANPSPGWWTIDKATLGKRFLAGRPTSLDGAARTLATTELLIRLPKGWTSTERCGVLIWVEAAPESDLNRPMDSTADALRLIMVGARRTGNEVLVAERFQFALDGVQSVKEQFFCDPSRIYISGISGGGRIASQLWACFPDVFTGAVPVVGLDGYEPVPAGGGKIHAPHFAKPGPAIMKLLKQSRLAAITGDQDFNYTEIQGFIRSYARDGLPVRLVDVKGMGHEFPDAAKFEETMRWVDEPAATAAAAAAVKGQELLILAQKVPPGPDANALLEQVTVEAPWTPAAWKAARLLGAVPASSTVRK